MNRLMAPSSPACAANHIDTVIHTPVHDRGAGVLRLEVALITQADVPRLQHLVVNRAVRRMTHRAALAHDFMFEYKRSGLRGMTFRARRIYRCGQCLRSTDCRVRVAFVRLVAAGARNLSLEDRMRMGMSKFGTCINVTLHDCGVTDIRGD